MTFTEHQLRESLRRTTTEAPDAGDRVAQVQRRVRRHRRRTIATVAAVVALAIAAVPVTRAVVDRQARIEVATPGTLAEQMDATMKYAAFVAWWSGTVAGASPPAGWDAGVEGVVVTTTLPPTMCAVVSMAAGEPAGTQGAWVLGEGSIVGTVAGGGGSAVVTTSWLWPVGIEGCDPRPAGTALFPSPTAQESGLVAGGVAYAATLGDRTRPALDVESVFRAVPPDRLTQHGRDVFAAYQAKLPTSYGSEGYQLDQVLTILGSWIGIALGNAVAIEPSSPQTGAALLSGDDWMGSAGIPEGFSARWDPATRAFCVEGSIGGTGVRHLNETGFVTSGSTPSIEEGPCPAG